MKHIQAISKFSFVLHFNNILECTVRQNTNTHLHMQASQPAGSQSNTTRHLQARSMQPSKVAYSQDGAHITHNSEFTHTQVRTLNFAM